MPQFNEKRRGKGVNEGYKVSRPCRSRHWYWELAYASGEELSITEGVHGQLNIVILVQAFER